MFRGHYQILCLFFFLKMQNCHGIGCAKWKDRLLWVHSSILNSQCCESCKINLTSRKVRLLGILIQHPFIRKVLYKYFRICHFGLLNLDLYLCSWRRSMSEYLYLEYIYLFRVSRCWYFCLYFCKVINQTIFLLPH